MRVAIVNDVAIAAEALRRVVMRMPNHSVAWIARDGAEAVQECRRDTPDLILMDLLMPVMGGAEAIRQIMAATPCAILVVTADVSGNTAEIFEALGAGALDVVQTPSLAGESQMDGVASLRFKIDAIGRLIASESDTRPVPNPAIKSVPQRGLKRGLVAIGASAGGPAALSTILGGLSPDFPATIVIVQHVDMQFSPQLASWLNQQSALTVRVAGQGDRIQDGAVLLAGGAGHLVMLDSKSLGYSLEPKESLHRPSVDVFLESVARHWQGDGVGVILTGMGKDGAKGLKAMQGAGFHTIAQDQASCTVNGMPKAATDLGAAKEILPAKEIAKSLSDFFSKRNGGLFSEN